MSNAASAVAIALASLLSLAACASTTNAVALPTDPAWHGGGCRGTGTDAVIHGSATDPRVTWVTATDGTHRMEIVWPVGYSARFSPSLEVLDQHGTVVAREGDHLIGWCLTAQHPEQPIWVEGGNDIVPGPSST